MREQLKEALAHAGGPTVVDVVVNDRALLLPTTIDAAMVKAFGKSVLRRAAAGEISELWEEAKDNIRLL